MESESDKSPVADIRRMIIRVFNKLKEDKKTKQNNNEFQDSTDKT
jgi:hypothetical protein